MYLARISHKGKIRYVLRQSYRQGKTYRHRDLYGLGPNPRKYIKYPGGNAFYVDEAIEARLHALGVATDGDTLADLFWPFVRPDIKRSISHFKNRSQYSKNSRKLTQDEKDKINTAIPEFDKRRQHYLKYGDMNQGPVARMPPALFRELLDKSRDEIEQRFIIAERLLSRTELKNYVYVAFNLQRFFQNFMAKKMPQVLDQVQIESHFEKEICRVNRALFAGNHSCGNPPLHAYLVRYLIMFFDSDYAHSTLLDDFVNDFMSRRRQHRFSRPKFTEASMDLAEASDIFGISKETLVSLDNRNLDKRYRRLAQKYHPDKGGTHRRFIALTEAYQRLLHRIGRKS